MYDEQVQHAKNYHLYAKQQAERDFYETCIKKHIPYQCPGKSRAYVPPIPDETLIKFR